MKLGILGMLPGDPAAITGEVLQRVRAAGFAGAGVNFRTGLETLTPAVCRRLRADAAAAGLTLVELGMYGTNLVHSDPAVRAANVRSLQRALAVAAELGGPAVITGSGSRNPRGQFLPHRENHGPEPYRLMVESLREVARAAESEGVRLGLECHTVTVLRTPEVARRAVDDVGSASLKVHLDPVNWITFETIYRTGEAIDHMFEVLGPDYLLGAHAKGVTIQDRLICHLDETVAGAPGDLLDMQAFLRQMARLPGDPFVIVEHTPPEQIPAARNYVLAQAAAAGVAFAA